MDSDLIERGNEVREEVVVYVYVNRDMRTNQLSQE